MIHVIATLTTRAGQRDTLLQAFYKIQAEVLAKRGCVEYTPARHFESGLLGQGPYDDDEVLIVEKWADKESLEAHIDDPKYAAWFDGIQEMIVDASMQILYSEE
jgi:quinol monooxygenase YgiN